MVPTNAQKYYLRHDVIGSCIHWILFEGGWGGVRSWGNGWPSGQVGGSVAKVLLSMLRGKVQDPLQFDRGFVFRSCPSLSTLAQPPRCKAVVQASNPAWPWCSTMDGLVEIHLFNSIQE
eukprot:4391026-Amphidinium_carterae.1